MADIESKCLMEACYAVSRLAAASDWKFTASAKLTFTFSTMQDYVHARMDVLRALVRDVGVVGFSGKDFTRTGPTSEEIDICGVVFRLEGPHGVIDAIRQGRVLYRRNI